MPSTVGSQYHQPTRKYLKGDAVNKKIGEATGKKEMGGAVDNLSPGPKPSVSFRQVGSVPDDKSGFPIQHLGDKK